MKHKCLNCDKELLIKNIPGLDPYEWWAGCTETSCTITGIADTKEGALAEYYYWFGKGVGEGRFEPWI